MQEMLHKSMFVTCKMHTWDECSRKTRTGPCNSVNYLGHSKNVSCCWWWWW